MANPDVQPWTPDPSTAPGTPPSQAWGSGTGGERGTNAYPGDGNFNAHGQRTGGFMGPLKGTDYHPEGVASAARSAGSISETHRQGETLTAVLTADNTTPVHATPVTLTATLTATSPDAPTGTVTFKDGATTLGTATVTEPGDTAVYTHAAGLTTGAHTLTAVYGGDANYPQTTSAGLTVTAS